MKPFYKYGYQCRSILLTILCIIITLMFPLIITLMIKNMISSPKLILDYRFTIVTYLIILLFLISIIFNSQIPCSYWFYHSFMLYKEKLSLRDYFNLLFINGDLNKLENYFNKRYYTNITTLNIIVRKIKMAQAFDTALEIKFQLVFDDGKLFTFIIPEATKDAYQQFLEPFIRYHIKINDPYDLINGLQQPLRLIEYFEQNKSMVN